MSGFDLIIFDCDGVLVDSEIIAAQVESRLLTEAGYPISVEEMGERFAGMTWKNILLQVESEASIPLSASLLDKSEKLLDMRLERDVKIIEGVKFALSRLTTPRCICSNSSSHRLDMMLTKVGLKPYFAPHIYSAKDLGADRVKPKPDIFLHGAAQFGVSPDRVVVVEVGTTQLLLGVGSGGIQTLHTLTEPLPAASAPATAASPFAQLLAQHLGKKA